MKEIWVIESKGHIDGVRFDEASAEQMKEICRRTWQKVRFRVVRYVPAPTKKPKAKKGTR